MEQQTHLHEVGVPGISRDAEVIVALFLWRASIPLLFTRGSPRISNVPFSSVVRRRGLPELTVSGPLAECRSLDTHDTWKSAQIARTWSIPRAERGGNRKWKAWRKKTKEKTQLPASRECGNWGPVGVSSGPSGVCAAFNTLRRNGNGQLASKNNARSSAIGIESGIAIVVNTSLCCQLSLDRLGAHLLTCSAQ